MELHSTANDKDNKRLSASHWVPSISNLKVQQNTQRELLVTQKGCEVWDFISYTIFGNARMFNKFNDIYCLLDEGFWQFPYHDE